MKKFISIMVVIALTLCFTMSAFAEGAVQSASSSEEFDVEVYPAPLVFELYWATDNTFTSADGQTWDQPYADLYIINRSSYAIKFVSASVDNTGKPAGLGDATWELIGWYYNPNYLNNGENCAVFVRPGAITPSGLGIRSYTAIVNVTVEAAA